MTCHIDRINVQCVYKNKRQPYYHHQFRSNSVRFLEHWIRFDPWRLAKKETNIKCGMRFKDKYTSAWDTCIYRRFFSSLPMSHLLRNRNFNWQNLETKSQKRTMRYFFVCINRFEMTFFSFSENYHCQCVYWMTVLCVCVKCLWRKKFTLCTYENLKQSSKEVAIYRRYSVSFRIIQRQKVDWNKTKKMFLIFRFRRISLSQKGKYSVSNINHIEVFFLHWCFCSMQCVFEINSLYIICIFVCICCGRINSCI